jgi:hypothetical protein
MWLGGRIRHYQSLGIAIHWVAAQPQSHKPISRPSDDPSSRNARQVAWVTFGGWGGEEHQSGFWGERIRTCIRLDGPIFGGSDGACKKAALIERETHFVCLESHRSVKLITRGTEVLKIEVLERKKQHQRLRCRHPRFLRPDPLERGNTAE